jgi:hypothetical protein
MCPALHIPSYDREPFEVSVQLMFDPALRKRRPPLSPMSSTSAAFELSRGATSERLGDQWAAPGLPLRSRGTLGSLVFRAALIAAVMCISFEVSGLAALCGDPPCSEECPTDRSGGECPPNCHTCACCSLPTVTDASPHAVLLPPDFQPGSWVRTAEVPFSPEPAEILHVPKRVLA